MNIIIKTILLAMMTCAMQSCFMLFDIYKPNGETANLTIDMEEPYEKNIAVLISDIKPDYISAHEKLLYGLVNFNTQENNHVKVGANKKIYLRLYFTIDSVSYCNIRASYTLSPGKNYRLSGGVEFDKDRGFFHNIEDKCYIQLSEVANGALIPVYPE